MAFDARRGTLLFVRRDATKPSTNVRMFPPPLHSGWHLPCYIFCTTSRCQLCTRSCAEHKPTCGQQLHAPTGLSMCTPLAQRVFGQQQRFSGVAGTRATRSHGASYEYLRAAFEDLFYLMLNLCVICTVYRVPALLRQATSQALPGVTPSAASSTLQVPIRYGVWSTSMLWGSSQTSYYYSKICSSLFSSPC